MFSGKQTPLYFHQHLILHPYKNIRFQLLPCTKKPRYVSMSPVIVPLWSCMLQAKKKGLYLTWCMYTLEVYLLQSCILTYIIKHSHALCLWTQYMKLQVSHSYNYSPIDHPVTYPTLLLVKWHSDLSIKSQYPTFCDSIKRFIRTDARNGMSS